MLAQFLPQYRWEARIDGKDPRSEGAARALRLRAPRRLDVTASAVASNRVQLPTTCHFDAALDRLNPGACARSP